jgi:hypothetical protein
MRKIMFRAFDKIRKIFVSTDFNIIGETTVFGVLDQYSLEGLNNLEIQQWTGYEDRFGNKIYEGDICRYKGSPPPMEYKPRDMEIFWGNEQFQENGFFVKDGKGLVWRLDKDFCERYLNVIGNIYEKD